MARLEMCFPPGSFDIMEHLMIHMVNQICTLGPLYLHEMWTYEYFMSHCRKSQVCRVPAALPSAQYRTSGKYNLCQVHTEKHSANLWHSASYGFAECRTNDTRRTTLFAESLLGALVLYLFAKCLDKGTRQNVSRAPHARNTRPLCPLLLWAVILCWVPPQSTRYLINLPSAYTRAFGKLGHVPRTSPLPWEGRDARYCLPSA
jgi:hypothetical protein